jgi:HSP20 family molecular chaperone IbpA
MKYYERGIFMTNSTNSVLADLLTNTLNSAFAGAASVKSKGEKIADEAKDFDPMQFFHGLQDAFTAPTPDDLREKEAHVRDLFTAFRDNFAEKVAEAKASASTASDNSNDSKPAADKSTSASAASTSTTEDAASAADATPRTSEEEEACSDDCFCETNDSLLDDFFKKAFDSVNEAFEARAARPVTLPIDVTEIDNKMFIKAFVPGVTEEEVTVRLGKNDILEIKVTPNVSESSEINVHNELGRPRNAIREVIITERFAPESITASLINGVLTVSVDLLGRGTAWGDIKINTEA